MTDVREVVPGDYIELQSGALAEIASVWGVSPSGKLAPPSKGGFGVVTTSGQRVTMFEAKAYHKRTEIGECMFCHQQKVLEYQIEITARWRRGRPVTQNGNSCEECAVKAIEDLVRMSRRR